VILSEKREGRVSDHDVRLFQKCDALRATEIAAGILFGAFQRRPGSLVSLEEKFDVRHVRSAVAVLVFHVVENDG
jgi:hypothetical protein